MKDKDKDMLDLSANAPPTEEQKIKFRQNIDKIITENIRQLVLLQKYDTLNMWLRTFLMEEAIQIYVLESILDNTLQCKDELPFRSVFIDLVEKHAKNRNEFIDENQFGQYR